MRKIEKDRRFSKAELAFMEEAKKRGYRLYKAGYPDFVVAGKNGVPFFVEVKQGKDNLSPSQENMFDVLRRMGFTVLMSRNGEWIEPTIINSPQKYDSLVVAAHYYHNKLIWLKQEIASEAIDIDCELKKLDELESRLVNMGRKIKNLPSGYDGNES